MDLTSRILSPDVLVFLVLALGVIVGGIIAIFHMYQNHRERIHMIDQGIHPDYPPEEVDEEHGEKPQTP